MKFTSSQNSQDEPQPVGPYPHVNRVGDLLFLSGIGPRSPIDDSIPGAVLDEAGTVVAYDFEAQCRSTFENVRAVLHSAGGGLDDLVDVTVFLTDMASDFQTMNQIYAEYLRGDVPTRTTVEVRRLSTQIAIELKCIAALPSSHQTSRDR